MFNAVIRIRRVSFLGDKGKRSFFSPLFIVIIFGYFITYNFFFFFVNYFVLILLLADFLLTWGDHGNQEAHGHGYSLILGARNKFNRFVNFTLVRDILIFFFLPVETKTKIKF